MKITLDKVYIVMTMGYDEYEEKYETSVLKVTTNKSEAVKALRAERESTLDCYDEDDELKMRTSEYGYDIKNENDDTKVGAQIVEYRNLEVEIEENK